MAIQKWSKDVVAVVTGGNKGIGYEIVKGLAQAGITVILTARDEGRGTAALEALKKEGLDTIYFHKLDVTDANSAKELGAWLGQKFGGIDVLINNAGIVIRGVTHENATNTFETNYWGVQKVTDGLLPQLKPDGLRRIVNVSSKLGKLDSLKSEALKARIDAVDSMTLGDVNALAEKYLQDVKDENLEEWNTSKYSIYPESKVILNAYTRVIAKSLASKGISVNSTCPGHTATDLNGHAGPRTAAEGADTIIWLALLSVEDYPTGKFFADRKDIPF